MTNLIFEKWIETLPLIGLYAESHFRFRIPFSRYFKREPELIFDAPWRLEPGQRPTIFLVIKDAHLFPVTLNSVDIDVHHHQKLICRQSWSLDEHRNSQQSHLEFVLSECDLPGGEVEITPRLNYSVAGKDRLMIVDNYVQIEKHPLRITIGTDSLPKLKGWVSGDTHLHSSLTNDQIEFGASLEQTRKCAELIGMDFITATDHSYDLDDLPEDYLKNDPDLIKWKNSRDSIAEMNTKSNLTIIPGEEISVANARGDTVHLLHFNDPVYFPGSGDSGEDWPKLKSQLSIDDILQKRSDKTVSVGAHTAYKFPWSQRVLLKRGFWEAADHKNPDLEGVQILCGTPSSASFQASRQLWVEALLEGQHLGAYGGSDGHGNFNRNWHVKLPVWSLGIHEDQIFAQSRTLLRSISNGTDDLIEAMKACRTALTTGPVGEMKLSCSGQLYEIGDTAKLEKGSALELKVNAYSTQEFGSQLDVSIYVGNLESVQESLLFHQADLASGLDLTLEHTPEASGYLRLEITSDGSRWPGLYLSSPIWIDLI
ncbi:MAG: hypothetical protein HQ508_04820 [Candidatus Marinimicrobia bacterium]|nr:hypothetical protein [Candidatus Neomarinimicrobiota bacterium]